MGGVAEVGGEVCGNVCMKQNVYNVCILMG